MEDKHERGKIGVGYIFFFFLLRCGLFSDFSLKISNGNRDIFVVLIEVEVGCRSLYCYVVVFRSNVLFLWSCWS